MSNLTTESVYVFPFSKPRTNSPLDNVFYEQNTTNMIRQLSKAFFKMDSFIIADTVPWIEFNIHGYYFKVDKVALATLFDESMENVTAYIIVKNATDTIPEYLLGQDANNDNFTSLHFTNSEVPDNGDDTTVYSLKLYDASGSLRLTDTQITGIDAEHS